jgi:hypothetical protein
MQDKFTEEEFIEMVNFLKDVKDYLPENKVGYVWNSYKIISGDTSNQPCTCGSAAGHWKRAIDTMRTYVKDNS